MTKSRSTENRSIKRALRKLRERYRKHDTVYKTAKIIEELAKHNNSIIVVGNTYPQMGAHGVGLDRAS